ncbi:MAG TPA: O-antigen ligase family protein [Candidatus Acidoferrales bacterium]|jgi:O-antigen ligase
MKIIRIGVCVLVTFAVLAFGAVETWSESVLQIGAALLFLWWGSLMASGHGKEIRWSPVTWPLLGLELLALLQFAIPLSLYPYLTKLEVLRMTSYLILLFLSGQAFRTPRQWRDFAWFVVLLGFTVAVFAVLQDLTFKGKLYWFREMRYGGMPYGPYVNRNHFAGLMELLIPTGLAMLAVPGVRRQQMPLMALLAAMPVGALLLSASRGGIIGFGCEVILLVVLLWIRRGEKKRLFTFLVALVLAGGLVAWLGVGQVIQRFSQIHDPEVTEGRRISMASGAYHIFRDHPWIGTGVGTMISVYPAYETAYDATIVDHVHDDHFELLAETGVLGALCWLTFIVLLAVYGLKNVSAHQDPVVHAVQLGTLVGCAGLLIHSFVDFNLHIPANASLFYLMAGMASTNPIFGPTN